MAAPKKTKPTTRFPATVFLTALMAAPLLVAPSIVRGLAAEAWVRHYAALDALPTPRRATAREIVARADRAVWYLAPLPQASHAAMTALEIGERLEHQDHDRDAAILIYQGVRASCVRVKERLFAGGGFGVIEARAAALELSARRGEGQ